MRNFHLEDPKFSWTKVKVFGSCYKTSIHVNIFSPIESGLVLLLYIFCGNYLEILYLTNYSFFLLTDATNLYNLVAFSGSSLNHFHFLLDYGTNNCSFTITFFYLPSWYFVFSHLLTRFNLRVLLVVSSLKKKFSGILSEMEILGSKHVIKYFICYESFSWINTLLRFHIK